MSISKRALLASGAGLVIGLSTAAIAQTKGNAKSQEVTTVEEGEAACYDWPKGPEAAQVQGQGERCPARSGPEEGRP